MGERSHCTTTCDYRTDGKRCGHAPVTQLEGRGPLCADHLQDVVDDRADLAKLRADLAKLRADLAKLRADLAKLADAKQAYNDLLRDRAARARKQR